MQDALSIRSQLFNKNDQKSQIHLSNLGRVICIVGAPRSGTSILTHALSHLGVDLGSPEEMDGYMDSERQPFRDINIEIVRRIAISSLLPAQQILKDGWEKDQQFADLRQKAQEVIASQFKGKKLWGWKMPATTITIPFWETVLGPPEYIVCIRNPLSVALSLEKSGEVARGQTVKTGMVTWLLYTSLALKYTESRKRFIFTYESALENPQETMADLADFLGVTDGQKIEAAARLFKQPRHQVTLHDMMTHPLVPSEARLLYWLSRALSLALKCHRADEEDAINCAIRTVSQAFLSSYIIRRSSWKARIHDFLFRYGQRLVRRPLPHFLKKIREWLVS